MGRFLVVMTCVLLSLTKATDTDLFPFLGKAAAPQADATGVQADGAGVHVMIPVVKVVDPKTPFPQLPAVTLMLNRSDNTVSSISKEVSEIEARVHSLEQQDGLQLAQKKAKFEAELHTEEQDTRNVNAENSRIAMRIASLQKGNEDLRQRSKSLREETKGMRTELHSAGSTISVSGDFIKSSLKKTDDHKSPELAVLSTTTKVHRQMPAIQPAASGDDGGVDGSTDTALDDRDATKDAPVVTPTNTEEEADVEAAPELQPPSQTPHGLFGRAQTKVNSVVSTKREDEDDDTDDKDDTDTDKDDDDDKSDDNKPESFLMVSMHTRRRLEEGMEAEDTQDGDDSAQLPWGHSKRHHHSSAVEPAVIDQQSKALLQSVSEGLQDLAREDHDEQGQQVQIFHTDSAKERRSYKEALAQQRQLNRTEASLMAEQSKLKTAVSHLEATQSHVEQRLRGLGQYLQHLAHLLLAPPKEAQELVAAMPKDVSIPPPLPIDAAPTTTTTTTTVGPTHK